MRPLQTDTVSSLAGYRLLVVEDDYFVAQDLCATLREYGCDSAWAGPSVSSARSLAGALRPDCVLLDINLDGELAFELARELRRAACALSSRPATMHPSSHSICAHCLPAEARWMPPRCLRSIRERPPGTPLA